MIDNSDVVIAYWDGTKGGTGNAVSYSEETGKPIYNVYERKASTNPDVADIYTSVCNSFKFM